jgi:hypothetical protein
MNDRLGTEEGRPDLLGDSVPEAEVELYCEFGLRDVGKGKVCFGKPDIFESEYEDSVDTHKQCFVYISLIVKPEGWKIPVFGNYGSRAERLSKRTGEHLKNVLDMPLDVARGKMPWVWSDYDCSYSVEKLYGDRMMVAILSNYTAGGYWDLFRGA